MGTSLTIWEKIVREFVTRFEALTLTNPGGVYDATRTVQRVTRDGEGADMKVETKPLVDIDTTMEPEIKYINIEQVQVIHPLSITLIDDRVLETQDEFDKMTIAMEGDIISTVFTDRNDDRDVSCYDLTENLAVIVHPGLTRRFATKLYGGSVAAQGIFRVQYRTKINDPTVIV